MGADVPPDVRVVGDAAGALELADHLRVVGVVAKAGRRPGAGEGREDHCRLDAEAGRSPRQNGELAESASSGARCGSSPLTIRIALSGSSTARGCACRRSALAGRLLELIDEGAIAVRAVIRCRSNRLNGCVPAEPTRRPLARAIRRRSRAASPAPRGRRPPFGRRASRSRAPTASAPRSPAARARVP